MSHPNVDILLATYNGEQFVGQQIDSILTQTHQEMRLIIRDDCSTDGTSEILASYAAKYPDTIVLLPSQQRLGIKGNFSELMRYAKSDYIMFADQDDVWECDKVALTLANMRELERRSPKGCPLLVHTDLQVVDENLNLVSKSFWNFTNINPFKGHSLNRLLNRNVVTGCTTMMNSALASLAIPIPEDAVMHDWWLALVASAFGKIEAVPKSTILYRQHGKNALGAKKFWSLAFFKQGVAKLQKSNSIKRNHANCLLSCYALQLSQKQIEMLKAFLNLSQASIPEKVATVLKYRFFNMGIVRSMADLLIQRQ